MADIDISVGELPEAAYFDGESILVVENQGQAQKVPGHMVKDFAAAGAGEAQRKAEAAAEKAAAAVVNPPTIGTNGNWYLWDFELGAYVDSGKPSEGSGTGGGAVQSVNGKTGAVVLGAADVGALPSSTKIPAKTSDLTNDSGFITGYTETDPTVPAWAKAASKPSYTADEVGALPKNTPIPSVVQSTGDSTSEVMSQAAVTNALNQLSNEKADQDTATLGPELVSASGWTLGAGWSGNLTNGFTHASGNTEPLTLTPAEIKAGSLYQVTFRSSVRMTTTNLFVQVGNSAQFNLYAEDTTNDTGNVSIGVLAADTTGLVFTPESTFTGTLTNISLKEITGSYPAVKQYFDTQNAASYEIHVTPRGLENVYIGQATGEMNTTGRENVGIGVNVLAQNTSGFWNVGIGKDCLKNNTAGSRNLALGYNALMSNEVGQRNVALGTFAMTRMRNGNWNIAIGSDSMNTATGGDKNVAVGFNTLVHNGGNNNVAIGADVLADNTTGIGNVGVGQGALSNNTSGVNNVCVGYNAGIAMTTANGNVGIGWAALYKTTTGAQNVAIGQGAGKAITTGKLNIIIGVEPEVNATGNYQLNIGNLLKGSLVSGSAYLLLNGGLRLPNIPTTAPGNDGVYVEEWAFTLEGGTTVTKKVLLK